MWPRPVSRFAEKFLGGQREFLENQNILLKLSCMCFAIFKTEKQAFLCSDDAGELYDDWGKSNPNFVPRSLSQFLKTKIGGENKKNHFQSPGKKMMESVKEQG